MSPSLIIN